MAFIPFVYMYYVGPLDKQYMISHQGDFVFAARRDMIVTPAISQKQNKRDKNIVAP